MKATHAFRISQAFVLAVGFQSWSLLNLRFASVWLVCLRAPFCLGFVSKERIFFFSFRSLCPGESDRIRQENGKPSSVIRSGVLTSTKLH